jgi:hypothetical protein
MLIGLVLATWPYGRRGDRFLWPLGIAVAVLGTGYSLYTFIIGVVPWSTGAPAAYWTGVLSLIGLPARFTAFGLVLTSAGIHLLARVRYTRNRALWFAALAVVMAQAVSLACNTSLLASFSRQAQCSSPSRVRPCWEYPDIGLRPSPRSSPSAHVGSTFGGSGA